jgi:hypothetical protein
MVEALIPGRFALTGEVREGKGHQNSINRAIIKVNNSERISLP